MALVNPVRSIPNAGLHAPALGYGCMSLTGFQSEKPLSDSELDSAAKILRRALELGATLINTADFYGPYQNQEVIEEIEESKSASHEGTMYCGGPSRASPREKVVIASKWGVVIGPGHHPKPNGTREHLREVVDASLKRMGVDYLDLLILRSPDPAVPLTETMKYMKELVEEGKVKGIGLCELPPEILRAAHAVHPISVIEQEYSLFSRDMENDVLPTCRELGIAVLAYSPLGRGFLTGSAQKDKPAMPSHPWWDNYDKNMELVGKVKRMAEAKGCTPAQLSLAWLLHKGDDIFPIPGTKRVECLEENMGALGVELSPEDMAALEAAVPHHEVAGSRWPDMRYTYHGHKTQPPSAPAS